MLITAEAPLEPNLRLLAAEPFYRLVLRGSDIAGIVTRSDLLKLPVRMLAFALAFQVEMLMSERIRARFPDDTAWLKLLSADDRQFVERWFKKYKDMEMELTRLEVASFGNKRTVLDLAFDLDADTKSQLEQVQRLRNDAAHPHPYAGSRKALLVFIGRIEAATRLTAKWEADLKP